MARRVYYSFHYRADCARAARVRNMGVVEGNKPATDNDWETITQRGSKAIQKWIDDQLFGKSCNVVLIGENTAGRKWINYEIETAWNSNKGVVGVYIHRLKDFDGNQSSKGRNPFEDFTMDGSQTKLSSIVRAYNPPYTYSRTPMPISATTLLTGSKKPSLSGKIMNRRSMNLVNAPKRRRLRHEDHSSRDMNGTAGAATSW